MFNSFLFKISVVIHTIHFFFITVVECMLWYLRGVKYGKNLRFSGWCHMNRFNNSKIEIGDNVHFVSSSFINHIGINHKCSISTEKKDASIRIGNNCGFSSTCIIAFKRIEIGNNVRVGANSVIMDGDFHDDNRTKEDSSIIVNNNVWIGANAVVMKGVTIGENSIIGINSVVTKDIPSNCVAAGNPCKVIREL